MECILAGRMHQKRRMIPKRDIESEGQLLNSQFAELPPPLAYFKLLDAGEKRTEAQRPSECGSFTSLAP